MASITLVGGKWRALCRRVGHKSKCKTFAVKAQAERWARQVEGEWDAGVVSAPGPTVTVAEVIKAYQKLRESSRPIADTSTEHYQLKNLTAGLGEHRVIAMTPQHLVDFATQRKEDGAGPYTINMDVSKLGTVLRYGGAAMGVVFPDIVGTARPLLTHLRLIGGGGKRERRPTEDELRRVLHRLTEHRGLVYAEAVAFSAVSAMRRGEVCALRREDINPDTKIVEVERKHPRKGKTLERVPLLGEAWDIIQRQPEAEDGRVFPIEPGTLSKYFTEACRHLSIPDLHLHDLRHEGTSRLFEEGYQIHEVALVTGHRKWENLRRYTQLRPEDLTRSDEQPSQDEQPPRNKRRGPPRQS